MKNFNFAFTIESVASFRLQKLMEKIQGININGHDHGSSFKSKITDNDGVSSNGGKNTSVDLIFTITLLNILLFCEGKLMSKFGDVVSDMDKDFVEILNKFKKGEKLEKIMCIMNDTKLSIEDIFKKDDRVFFVLNQDGVYKFNKNNTVVKQMIENNIGLDILVF